MLQVEGPLSIALLAQRRLVKHQSMRLVVEQLVFERAAEKETDPTDRRSQLVRITDEGRSLIKKEQRSRTEWIAKLVGACSPAEQERVLAAIHTLEELLLKASVSD